ncbi:MAG: phosphatidate cytidylyltransferase [Burkholderiales bacterium]
MLKQRVITAVVLLAVLLPALFAASPWPFALITLLMLSAAGWEWARLNGVAGWPAWLLGAVVALGAAAMAGSGWVGAAPVWLWDGAILLWVLGGAYALRAGVSAWPGYSRTLRLVLGVLMLWLAWLAIAVARSHGVNLLLSIFCLVWVADIAAYFGGRTFGRRKLAPAISPGKSWEGVVSGMLGVLLLGGLWIWIDGHWVMDTPSLYSRLLAQHGLVGTVVALVFLAAMSVVGDLFESLVKRSAGAKDSSRLLPGHGGVLDRIDALLPVCPLALALLGTTI